MDERAAVVLVGDSVLMDALDVSLRNALELNVVRMDAGAAGLQGCLNATEPKLIVFPLDGASAPTILSLLHQRPGTIFLGIDHTCSQVVVMKGKGYPVRSLQEFCQLAEAQLAGEAGMRRGGDLSKHTGHRCVEEEVDN